MTSFVSSIIDWFKKMFNIKLKAKDGAGFTTDYFDLEKPSITAMLSNRLTSLTITDSAINIVGDNKRAKYLDGIMQWLNDNKLGTITEVCLGTGDCIVKPITDGKRISVDIVSSDKFYIIDSIGDFVKSALIKCDEFRKENNVYERWEKHTLYESDAMNYVSIEQVAFMNGQQIPMASVNAWANIKEMQSVPNCDKLLLARFKCPKTNRTNVNSVDGVPITSGAEYFVDEANKSFGRYNGEFDKSDKFLMADKRVFKSKKVKNSDGTYSETTTLPKDKKDVIMTVNGSTSVDGSPLISEFNPAIREAELRAGIEENFRLIELFCGFDSGVLSESKQSYENLDATRKSVQNTFAFICRLRSVLESGLGDLLYAFNIICNYNNITPMGSAELDVTWSDAYVENYTERFNQMMQGLSFNIITRAEMRAWLMDEPIDIATENIEAMGEDYTDIDTNINEE